MKKHIYTILIIIFCAVFILISLQKPKQYKVIEVFSGDLICIDLNNNSVCEKQEHAKIHGYSAFPLKFSNQSKYIEQKYNIKEKDVVVLGVMSKDYTSKNLLNNKITVYILNDSNSKYKIVKLYIKNQDFSQTILKDGYAITQNNDYKMYENISIINKNIKHSKNFNYQLRNKKNGKIHTLDCEYGKKSSDYEIGIFDNEKYKKDYCNYCHKSTKTKNENNKISKKYNNYLTDNIKVYFSDFTSRLKPDTTCSSFECRFLLNNINNAKNSIDFAIFGLGNVPKIEQALINASKRGVKLRCITDEDSKHNNIYERTNILKNTLSGCKTDYIEGETAKFNNYLMHNKFFIFDNYSVWLGSANISETDLAGFSANNIIFIKSNNFAKIYKTEFENMYNGHFHTKKVSSNQLQSVNIENTNIKIAFSPQNNIISNHLINYIKNAKKSVYIQTFIFTHKPLADELIKLKKSGIDIKIIVDATSASAQYSMVKYLRENGIKVKVENYAGKMHMKSIIIDDTYFISGSMNLTKSAEKYNDENLLFIKNPQIASHAKNFFNYIWTKIPDKYLHYNISAESKESIGSCSDGIDNDYNGKIDKYDEKCK